MTTENGLVVTQVTGGETRSYLTNPNEWMGNVLATTDPVTGGISVSSGAVVAEQYGASPDATEDQNNTALVEAMATGGMVTLTIPGTYSFSKTLLVRSGGGLMVGKGVKLRKASGNPCHLVRNYYAQNALRGGHFSVSGGVATVTEWGHSRAIGDLVYLEGALTNTDINGPQTITAVSGVTWSFSCAGSNPTNTIAQRITCAPYHPVSGASFVRASSVVTVSESGHSRNVGDKVYIAGLGGTNSFNGAVEVTASTVGTSWTYASTGVDETATGTAQVLGDTDIAIQVDGELDGNLSGNAMDDAFSVNVVFGNIGNSSLSLAMSRDGGSRSVEIFNAKHVYLPLAHATGGKGTVQCESGVDCCSFGHISAEAITDDCFAMGVTGSGDATCSPSGIVSNGTNTVQRISGTSTTGLLKVFAYTGYDNGTLIVGSISGKGKAIGAASGATYIGGTMQKLVVGEIDVTPTATGQFGVALSGIAAYQHVVLGRARDNYTSLATTAFIDVTTAVGTLSFPDFEAKNYNTSYSPIMMESGASVTSLILDRPHLTAGNGSNCIRIKSGATVSNLHLNDATWEGAGAAGGANYYGSLLDVNSGGTLKNLYIQNLKPSIGQSASVFLLGGGSQTVNILINGVSWIGYAGAFSSLINDNGSSTSGNIYMQNFNGGSGIGNNIFQLSGSGTWRIKGSGWTYTAGKLALLTSGTVSASIDSTEAQIDMGANAGAPPAKLVPIAGDKIYNTNATGKGLYGRTAAGAWQLIF